MREIIKMTTCKMHFYLVYYNHKEKRKGDKKMYEYEIIYKSNGEHDFLFGYNLRDLARRYPEIDPNSYTIVYREYID